MGYVDQVLGTFLAVLFAQIPMGIGFIITGRITVSNLNQRLASVEKELLKMSNVLVSLAETQGRINLLDERLLQQGRRLDDITSTYAGVTLSRLKG